MKFRPTLSAIFCLSALLSGSAALADSQSLTRIQPAGPGSWATGSQSDSKWGASVIDTSSALHTDQLAPPATQSTSRTTTQNSTVSPSGATTSLPPFASVETNGKQKPEPKTSRHLSVAGATVGATDRAAKTGIGLTDRAAKTSIGATDKAAKTSLGLTDRAAKSSIGATDKAARASLGFTDRAAKTSVGLPFKAVKETFKAVF